MGRAKPKSKPQPRGTLLDQILKRLPFDELSFSRAVIDQAPLFRDISRYRVACLRRKNRAELTFKSLHAEIYLRLREQNSRVKKFTIQELKEQMELNQEIIAARLLMAQCEELDEMARSMQESVRMRRDMLKVFAFQLPGSQDLTITNARRSLLE